MTFPQQTVAVNDGMGRMFPGPPGHTFLPKLVPLPTPSCPRGTGKGWEAEGQPRVKFRAHFSLLASPCDRAPCCCPLHGPGWLLPQVAIYRLKVSWPLPGSPPGSPSCHATRGRHSLSRALSSSSRPASLHFAFFAPPHPKWGDICATSTQGPDILSLVELLSSPGEGRWREGAQVSGGINLTIQRQPTAQEATLRLSLGRLHRT